MLFNTSGEWIDPEHTESYAATGAPIDPLQEAPTTIVGTVTATGYVNGVPTPEAPANSRTDVVLYGREYTPTPTRETAWFWEMDWKAGSCSGDKCSQSSANQNQTISLSESQNGGPWKPTGDPSKGEAHDQISPEPKTFNQHWSVDGKQVQLVVGKDSNGNLVETWEVHVVINKLGDRPVYSPVP